MTLSIGKKLKSDTGRLQKTYTDEDGNEYTESHEEPYEYKKTHRNAS